MDFSGFAKRGARQRHRGADGTIFFGDVDGNIYALNPDGSQKWTYATGYHFYSTPTIDSNGHLYVPCEGPLLALDAATGTFLWSYFPEAKQSLDAMVDIGPDGTLYTSEWANGLVYALDPSGNLKWSFQANRGCQCCAAIGADGTVYTCSTGDSAGGTLFALNGATGALNWTYSDTAALAPSPEIAPDGTVYLLDSACHVFAFDPASGTEKWNATFAGDGPSWESAAIGSDGTIYACGFGAFCALSPVDGSSLWSFQTSSGDQLEDVPSIGGDGTIYIGTYPNTGSSSSGVYALNPSNGQQVWRYSVPSGVDSADIAIAADGILYFGSNDGKLYALQGDAPLAKLYASPSSLIGGAVSHGVVQLQGVAGPNGDKVSLASSSADVSVPTTVTVPMNGMGVSFEMATASVSSAEQVTITAHWSSSSLQTTVNLTPNSVSNFYVSPGAVYGGSSSNAVVQMAGSAPSGGVQVSLESLGAGVNLPSSVTVPSGSKGKSFEIGTSPVSTATPVSLQASYLSTTQTTSITLNPYPLSNFYSSPSTVYGGSSTRGVVQISGPAGPADVISLSCSDPAVSLPASVTILQNAKGASFSFSTSVVNSVDSVTLTASLNGIQKQTSLTLEPLPSLSGLTLNNSTPFMTYEATGKVTIGSAAGANLSVQASSDSPCVSIASQPVIAAGQTTASFLILANPISGQSPSPATISVTLNGTTLSQTVQVQPIMPTSESFSTSVLHAGQSATLTIKAAEAAGVEAFPISLSSDRAMLTVPSTTSMQPHTYQTTVQVQAAASVSSSTTVNVYASVGGSQVKATITVEP